jgi:L-aminopeptidase/D-esterase-like protein
MPQPQLLSAFAGHWTGRGTGVTVIVPPPGTVGSGEVRGGAPATRDFALLEPGRLVDRVDAVVLSGGSAFGLAAGDGVIKALRDRGAGLPTPYGPVPIVVGMSIFDRSVSNAGLADDPAQADTPVAEPGDPAPPGAPPDAAAGRLALAAALSGEPFAAGPVGAGAGAATGGWRGRTDSGGVGMAAGVVGKATVCAVIVVNAWGDVLGADGRPLFAPSGATPAGGQASVPFGKAAPLTNTTIGVVITDARLTKADCHLLAQSAHTGFARAIHPAHSRYDGDAVVALATGELGEEADVDLLRVVTTEVVTDAIRAAVARPTPP